MKQLVKVVIFSTVTMFTACVDQNSLSRITEERVMEHENIIDISQVPLQTYEEYVQAKKFMLEKYIMQNKYKHYFNSDDSTSGVAYLKDNTKIAYSFSKEYISEGILNRKYPFVEVVKIYYPDTKILHTEANSLNGLIIGKEISYNKQGEISKIIDNDAEYKRKGINYKKILEWADKEKIIDLKEAKMLQGNSFILSLQKFEEFWNKKWGSNNEEFGKKNNLTKEEQLKFFKHKNYWIFNIDYLEGYQKHYLFGADGKFIMNLGRSEKLR